MHITNNDLRRALEVGLRIERSFQEQDKTSESVMPNFTATHFVTKLCSMGQFSDNTQNLLRLVADTAVLQVHAEQARHDSKADVVEFTRHEIRCTAP